MKHGLLKTLVLYSAITAFSLGVGQGLVNAFSYDIFERCINGAIERDTFFCTSGPQVVIDASAAVLFVVFALVLLGTGKKALKKELPKFTLMGGIFFVLAILSWRMQINLQDNFVHFSSPLFEGPDSITDYFYIFYLLLDTIVIGFIIGLIAWLPGRLNKLAIPADKRNEPREEFSKKKSAKKSSSSKNKTNK